MSSSSRNAAASGSAILVSRARAAGTCTMPRRCLASPASASRSTATFRLSDDRSGNGRSTSIASGVSTGSTASLKKALIATRCASFKSAKASSRIRRAASAGSSSSPARRYSAATKACARSATAASCCTGVMPDRSQALSPASICCCRPATRTMKNSSRFEAQIAANFTRSSSGMSGSAASSSTRSLNASHDSSRLMKRPGSCAFAVMTPPSPTA